LRYSKKGSWLEEEEGEHDEKRSFERIIEVS